MMHFINRWTWKSSQYYINNDDGVIHACVLYYWTYILVFHQNKCTTAIKRMLFYYRHVYTLVFSQVFVCFWFLRCLLVQRVACGSEDVTI